MPAGYEVVLVNDGSSDDTQLVIEAAKERARFRSRSFRKPTRAWHGAQRRDRGAQGERMIFIDDDVLPTPILVAEHLAGRTPQPGRGRARRGDRRRELRDLPAPFWTPPNYSGNYFWTSNVSAARRSLDLDRIGGVWFDESFSEYGWEDIELGMRLRENGIRGAFNRCAVAFHYKPKSERVRAIEDLVRQKRAQARTAVILARSIRVGACVLPPGIRWYSARCIAPCARCHLQRGPGGAASDAYYDELERGG